MNAQNHDDSQSNDAHQTDLGQSSPASADRDVVQTTDPAVARGARSNQSGHFVPDETFVAETDRITHAQPSFLAAPHAFVEPIAGGSGQPRSGQAPKNQADDDQQANHHPARPGVVGYVANGLIALVCGVGGALLFSSLNSSKSGDAAASSQKSGEAKKEASAKAAQRPAAGEGGVTGSEIPGFTSATDADTVMGQIQHLSSRFDTLQQQVDSLSIPHNDLPPDIGTLRIKLGELTHTVGEISTIPSQTRQMENRVTQLQEELRGLRDQLTNMQNRAGSSNATPNINAVDQRMEALAGPAPTTPPSAAPMEPNSPDFALAEGIALFKRGKYAQADNIFRKLQITDTTDARVWYYSALAHGLATGQWDGDTRKYVLQGGERERAGTPSTSQIDAAFAELSPAQGKDWLSQYRNQMIKP